VVERAVRLKDEAGSGVSVRDAPAALTLVVERAVRLRNEAGSGVSRPILFSRADDPATATSRAAD
jgi:hypothetical protein